MNCSFEFCIYQHEGTCSQSEVKINDLGLCANIELVRMDSDILKQFKKMRQREIEIMKRKK